MFRGEYNFYGDVTKTVPADTELVFEIAVIDPIQRDILAAGGVTDLSDAYWSWTALVKTDRDRDIDDMLSAFVKTTNKILLVESVSIQRTDVVCRLIKEL